MTWKGLGKLRYTTVHSSFVELKWKNGRATSVMTSPYEDLSAAFGLLDPGLEIGVAGHNVEIPGNAVVKDATNPHPKLGADTNRYEPTRVFTTQLQNVRKLIFNESEATKLCPREESGSVNDVKTRDKPRTAVLNRRSQEKKQ